MFYRLICVFMKFVNRKKMKLSAISRSVCSVPFVISLIFLVILMLSLGGNDRNPKQAVNVNRPSKFSQSAVQARQGNVESRLEPAKQVIDASRPVPAPQGTDESKPVVYTFDGEWKVNDTVCRNLQPMPRFPLEHIKNPMEIYTFNPNNDVISKSIQASKMFDPADFNVMYHFFGNDTDAHFIDIGANLGVHTIKMAEIGKRSFGVEISYECVQRICASTRFNKLQDNVVMIHNAIGADHKDLKYIKTKENFGFNFVEGDHSKKVMEGTFGKRMFNGIPVIVKSTTLDDVLNNPHFKGIKTVFIKLDVEGFEHKVIEGSDKFFKEVNVKGLYMEWNKQGSFKTGEYITSKMQSRGFEAYDCSPLSTSKKCTLLSEAQLKTKVYNILWLPKK